MKKIIKILIKEIIPIIVGILIALWINNWNEDQKDKKYISQISSSLDKELIETAEDITYNIKNQKSLVDTIEFYKNDDKISILDIVKKVNGIKMPTIRINSWKAISNSKIELMEYNKVSTLANIEEQKELLKTKNQNLMNFIFPNTKDTGIDKKELLKLMILDIISTEKALQKQIEEIS
ncbi:hypothetical protein GO491_04695 [Flavobacteriaceae bacterium Ap0902]|nr:hypothetical protein [Flavobacteriaceae bacterium Ap0902]